jgi:hypothetical protein
MRVAGVLPFAILVVLAGCAATGERYSGHAAVLTDLARDNTRITVFRTTEHSTYGGTSATVRIDGRIVGGCEYGGYVVFFTTPGSHVLAVDQAGAPGACSLAADLIGGEDYFYEIAPRSESSMANLLGTLVGALGGQAIIGSYAGMGAESAGKRCGGGFSIERVAEDAALGKLTHLRASK